MNSNTEYNLNVFQTLDNLSKATAEIFIHEAKESIALRGRFVVALSGGQTPQKFFSLLAESPFRDLVDWEKTHVFWGDERCVPLNDIRNNAFVAIQILLSKVHIPNSNIHRIPVELSPEDAAAKYEIELKDFFGDTTLTFDLILLGLGENGHTASLFPGTKVLDEKIGGVRALYVRSENMFRITMNAPMINLARRIVFLVSGEKKAGILKDVLAAPYEPDHFPAQIIKPIGGKLEWLVDINAAKLMVK